MMRDYRLGVHRLRCVPLLLGDGDTRRRCTLIGVPTQVIKR